MNLLQFCGCRPVVCGDDCIYRGAAFDGQCFYMTCRAARRIHVFDKCLRYLKCLNCRRSYGSICFDGSCGCFWALSPEYPGCVYRLDDRLRETDCFSTVLPDCRGFPLGISVCDRRCLLLCGAFGAASVLKSDGKFVSFVEKAQEKLRISAAVSLPCGFVAAYSCGGTQSLVWRNSNHSGDVRCWLPERVRIEDIAWSEAGGCYCLHVLLTKRCRYSQLLNCLLCTVDENCGCCCPNCRKAESDKLNIFSRLSECKRENFCCGKTNCGKKVEEIISSVASVETALSHILNAEGEKIQAVLQRCGNTERIHQVNNDVYKTVTAVTQLEQVLYSKMQIALELCSENTPNGCCESICGQTEAADAKKPDSAAF